jgi:hypothetical protein
MMRSRSQKFVNDFRNAVASRDPEAVMARYFVDYVDSAETSIGQYLANLKRA